jgi:hypothetical protein
MAVSGTSMMTVTVLMLRSHLCQTTISKQFLRLESVATPWTIPLGATTVDSFGDAEPWNVDANADASSSHISSHISSQEDWVLSGPDTPPIYLEDDANRSLGSDMHPTPRS